MQTRLRIRWEQEPQTQTAEDSSSSSGTAAPLPMMSRNKSLALSFSPRWHFHEHSFDEIFSARLQDWRGIPLPKSNVEVHRYRNTHHHSDLSQRSMGDANASQHACQGAGSSRTVTDWPQSLRWSAVFRARAGLRRTRIQILRLRRALATS